MKKIIVVTLMVLLIGAGAIWYWKSTQAKNIVFKNQGQQLVLKGLLYNNPGAVKIISKDQVNRQNIQDAFSSYVSAIKVFDKEWIVENVVNDYQESVRKQFNYSEITDQKNQPWDQVKVFGYVNFPKDNQENILVFAKIGDSGTLRPYPFAKTLDGWRFTDLLANDQNFDTVLNALRTGEYDYQ